MPKFSANLSMLFAELPFLERFEAAARAGFVAVEFAFPYEVPAGEVAAAARRCGLRTVLFNLPPGDWAAGERGLAAVPGREAEFRAGVERALPYIESLECPQVHAMAGVAPHGRQPADCAAVYVANLHAAARRLETAGARLLIEPINERDMPGYFLTTVEQARAILAAVGVRNLFLQMDLYHAQIMGGDLARRVRDHLPAVRHFQIAGAPDRHEPDRGEINYPYLFDLIDALGYAGWIGLEYRPAGETLAGLAWARRYGIVPRKPGGRR